MLTLKIFNDLITQLYAKEYGLPSNATLADIMEEREWRERLARAKFRIAISGKMGIRKSVENCTCVPR